MTTILFVHFRQCRRWQSNAMHRIQCCFPRYAIDNIARHYPRLIYAKEVQGDSMLYLFDVIADSEIVCLHLRDDQPLLALPKQIMEASKALKIPVWRIDSELNLYTPCSNASRKRQYSLH